MADPYASSKAAPPASSSLPKLPSGSGWASSVSDTPGLGRPQYLFPETDYDQSFRRSWGERLTYHVGTAYLIGTSLLSYPAAP